MILVYRDDRWGRTYEGYSEDPDIVHDYAAAIDLIPQSIMTENQASLMRFIFMGLALMLLMIFRPQGIFGDRKELALDAR